MVYPPKIAQIWIFGLKRNHLATLVQGDVSIGISWTIHHDLLSPANGASIEGIEICG
jgi:hypothetical protein